jgi:arginase
MIEQNFILIEAPLYQGQKHFGVSLGPAFIKQRLLDQGFSFENSIVSEPQSQTHLNLHIYESLCKEVARARRQNKTVLVAGGDHSLGLGSVQGALQVNPELKVIWVDAHGDINTRASSLTGAFHGMPVAFLLGFDRMLDQPWISTYLKPENLIYFGVRDLDPEEKRFLDVYKIRHYSVEMINERGLYNVIDEIVKSVQGSEVHFSIDSDAFDPSVAPSTGVRVNAGLTFESVARLVTEVVQVATVKSCDYVELNPQIMNQAGDVERTAQLGIELFNIILQNDLQAKENVNGFNDRQRHPEKPNLLHSSF